jgi:integrase
MPVIKMTQSNLATLQVPEGKNRIEWVDESTPGLYVLATANGTIASFFLRYKDSTGKTCHQTIGRTSEISLAAARTRAKQLRAEIRLGADPRGEEKARKAVLTFDEYFAGHYIVHAKNFKRSWRRDEELYRLRIKAVFGQKRLNQITCQQIQLFHAALKEEGLAPATCDHHVKLLKHALNLAIDWELLREKNPAARIPLFNADNRVENLLSDAELERLLTVLRTDRNRAPCLLAQFLMSTGVRESEATRAKWSDMDKENRRWYVPMTNSKSKRSRWVPLNESAMLVLNEIGTEGKYEYVFVNRRTGKPYLNIAKTWTKLREKANLPRLRIHDLRHGFATMLASAGRSLIEIGDLLGQAKSSSAITNRYVHLSQGQLREASAVASLKIMGTARAIPQQDAANTASVIITGAMPVAEVKTDAVVPGAAQQAA